MFYSALSHAATAICTDTKTTCVQAGGTRNIDGVDVTLPCWQYSIEKSCTAKADNNCQTLRDQGCHQINASCAVTLGDVCVVQDETYQCPKKTCHPADGVICGGEFYCMNGNCSPTDQPLPDKEATTRLDKAISGLAVVSAAAEGISNSKGISAFSGKALSCSDAVIGFNNCCQKTGWGKDIGLAHCTADEKKLGQAREKGLTTYVGRYCAHKMAKTCLSHHEVYCTFGSKLAQIVQDQGRDKQLGISFGAPKHPDCRGLTPEELQQLNFGKMNFKPLYKAMNAKLQFPKDNAASEAIMKRIEKFYHGKMPHA